MRADEFAALLHAKQIRRGHWIARCPAHGDKRPSLSIWEGNKHPVMFKCMSQGCAQDEVLAAMGLTWNDILSERPTMSREARRRLRDEQYLRDLREARRAIWLTECRRILESQPKASTLPGGYDPYMELARFGFSAPMFPFSAEWIRSIPGIAELERRIVMVENSLNPELQAIRERDAKTARFVQRWGWDVLMDKFIADPKGAEVVEHWGLHD